MDPLLMAICECPICGAKVCVRCKQAFSKETQRPLIPQNELARLQAQLDAIRHKQQMSACRCISQVDCRPRIEESMTPSVASSRLSSVSGSTDSSSCSTSFGSLDLEGVIAMQTNSLPRLKIAKRLQRPAVKKMREVEKTLRVVAKKELKEGEVLVKKEECKPRVDDGAPHADGEGGSSYIN